MRHFADLDDGARDALFAHLPQAFDTRAHRHDLGISIGAVLYTPATKAGVARDMLDGRPAGATTRVLCLEDAVADHEVGAGEAQLEAELRELWCAGDAGHPGFAHRPLLFVRARSASHIRALRHRLGELTRLLTGFVLPKFSSSNARAYLEAVHGDGGGWWSMPVLETPAVMFRETRDQELHELSRILHEHRDGIGCVRLGGTDFSGLYGIRRTPDLTIYDVGVVRDCIADIVNVLGRPGSGHVISGPVWEYFQPRTARVLKPQLRVNAFSDPGLEVREHLVSSGLDGLLRELLLDRANGLEGKTVIHPSHVLAVNAMSAVSHEDHADARAILDHAAGGAHGSTYANKMNEAKPHSEWARRVMRRAHAFGVLAEGVSHIALLEATVAARRAAVR